ncbi:type 4a pilus biogenesis protein PilO [Candidatus Sumerlaeota bacterium]|nr:type 4a pilus biogenesis protein PilO [Candidatus Sumerlaeota bacterium]
MNQKSQNALLIIMFLFLMVLCGLVYWRYMVLSTEMAAMNKTIKTKEMLIETHQKELDRLTALESRRDEIQTMLAKIEKILERLPREGEIPMLITNIKDMLDITGVFFMKSEQLRTVKRSEYAEIPYKIQCVAPYHNFGQLLNLIEVNQERLMRVKEFTIQFNERRPHLHDIDVTLVAYVNQR